MDCDEPLSPRPWPPCRGVGVVFGTEEGLDGVNVVLLPIAGSGGGSQRLPPFFPSNLCPLYLIFPRTGLELWLTTLQFRMKLAGNIALGVHFGNMVQHRDACSLSEARRSCFCTEENEKMNRA